MLLSMYNDIKNVYMIDIFLAAERLTSMDVDGPCAFPRPNSIQESVAGPLSVIGSFLIVLSFALAQMFIATEDLNRLSNTIRRYENSYQSSVEVNIDMQPATIDYLSIQQKM